MQQDLLPIDDKKDNNNIQELESDPIEPKAGDTISKSEYDRMMAEFSSKMAKLQKENETFKNDLKKNELTRLKEQENWQQVAEMKEREASEATERASMLEQALINEKKYEQLKTAALSAGLRKEALPDLELLDLDNLLAHETTSTGRVNIIGVKQAVDSIKAQRPHWFSNQRRNINTSLSDVHTKTEGDGSGSEITVDAIMKADKKARESGAKEDREAYYTMVKKFNEQKRG